MVAFLALKTSDEMRRFLVDLMTKKEVDEFSLRFQAAQMLSEQIPYSTIVKETGLSSTTIARVSRFLQSANGGYKTIIDRLHHHTSSQSRKGLS
ncbi:MAG: YerC/YecD family TrpR-related protein [Candidatus Uhrbacteria bacterium]|nr:YerC/YecD family TrpR-related protein [Candidatus Uhrbacteria bacterium]